MNLSVWPASPCHAGGVVLCITQRPRDVFNMRGHKRIKNKCRSGLKLYFIFYPSKLLRGDTEAMLNEIRPYINPLMWSLLSCPCLVFFNFLNVFIPVSLYKHIHTFVNISSYGHMALNLSFWKSTLSPYR